VRILRRILIALLALVLLVTLASVVYNASTSDAEVPVSQLWHGKFVDGTAYRVWGKHGSPVILLGGFAEPSFVWERVGPLLAQHHRVYALDLDGFGYSERCGPWTLAHWVDQVQSFARVLHLRKPIVAGHSLGAAVAVELARRGVASRIVLLDGDALRGGAPRWLMSALVDSPFFTTVYRVALGWPWVVRKIVVNAYGPKHPKIDTRVWTDPFRAKNARRALQALGRQGILGVTRQDLRRVTTPALVVWGAEDGVDPIASGRQTARDLGVRFVLVPNAGHLSMLAQPRAVARAIG
jgi:pimeloyl-ACP methyl ester carboxylesterase